MLIMSGLGAYMAYFNTEMLSVVVGVLTFYLIATAWMTVQRNQNQTGAFELITLVYSVGHRRCRSGFWF